MCHQLKRVDFSSLSGAECQYLMHITTNSSCHIHITYHCSWCWLESDVGQPAEEVSQSLCTDLLHPVWPRTPPQSLCTDQLHPVWPRTTPQSLCTDLHHTHEWAYRGARCCVEQVATLVSTNMSVGRCYQSSHHMNCNKSCCRVLAFCV